MMAGIIPLPQAPVPPTPPITPSAPASGAQLPAHVLRQFRMVFNAVRNHFQQVEKQVGIGGAQVWALHIIEQQAGVGVTDLARVMDIHQSTASNLVKSLLQAGLVRSEKTAHDRRAVQLHIQPQGQTLLAQAPGPYEGVLPEALQQLSPATLLRLHQDLDALLKQLQPDESAARIPLAEL